MFSTKIIWNDGDRVKSWRENNLSPPPLHFHTHGILPLYTNILESVTAMAIGVPNARGIRRQLPPRETERTSLPLNSVELARKSIRTAFYEARSAMSSATRTSSPHDVLLRIWFYPWFRGKEFAIFLFYSVQGCSLRIYRKKYTKLGCCSSIAATRDSLF